MLLARTVFDRPTVNFAVEAMEPPTREVKEIDVASRLSDKGGGGSDPDDDEDVEDAPSEPVEEGEEPELEEEAEEPAAPADLSEVWKQHGLSDLPADPTQFRSKWAQLNQQAAQAEQFRQHAAVLWQMNQQNLARQQAPAPQKPPQPWEIPQFDRRLVDQIMRDDAGNLIPKPGAVPTVVHDYQTWQAAREQALDKFLADPTGVFRQMGFITPQEAHQIAQAQIHQYHTQAALKQFEAANREWIFDGNGTLTPAANLWNQHYAQAVQMGHPDPINYATAFVDAAALQAQVASEAEREASGTTEDANAAKKKQLLMSATRKPNRAGSFPKPGKKGPPQNGKKDPWSNLRKQLSKLPPEDFEE